MYHRLVDDQSIIIDEYDIEISLFKQHVAIINERNLDVTFTFDDGYKSDLEAAKILNTYNKKGLFFVTTDWIGKKGHLSREDIKNIHEMGHKIGSHSSSHCMLNQVPEIQANIELKRSKETLEKIVGLKLLIFVFQVENILVMSSRLLKILDMKIFLFK